jgi:mitochondrial inner membrane protease ATP23
MSDKCYEQLQQCIATNRSVRRLLTALTSYGCPFQFDRHVTCETSSTRNIRGGFDRRHCQIVLFTNHIDSSDEFCTIFQHELIHAFDYCRAHVNFADPSHLACTEIRAAALTDQCSLFQHISRSSRPFRWKNQHVQCVKDRSRESMSNVCMDRSRNELEQIIDRVFSRCYNDTEPFDHVDGQQ